MGMAPDDTAIYLSHALAVAHELVAAGIPVFAAPPAPETKVGFRLPSRWQQTRPDPARIAEWAPGWALCMVCGHGLDGIDVDTYNDGADLALVQAALGGELPEIYGIAATASGGTHLLIASLGVASKNGLFPGIDIKAGEPGGTGRGFLFIAPTVKPSKVTGLPGQYGWIGAVDLPRLRAGGDRSGAGLAALVTASRQHGLSDLTHDNHHNGNGIQAASDSSIPSASQVMTPDEFMAQRAPPKGPWQDIPGTLAAEGRNNGVMRLAASLRETSSLSLEAAAAHMYEHVWPLIDQGQGGHEFPASEFEEVIAAVWRQYPGGGDRIAASAAALSDPAWTEQRTEDAARRGSPPLPHSALDLTDAFLVKWVSWTLNDGGMHGPYRWAPGLGWMRWKLTRWTPADVADVWEEVRQYFIWLLNTVSAAGADQALLARLVALLTKARISAITDLSRGHKLVRCDADEFDAWPDLLNTPAGITNLRTGETKAHDPGKMLTKITSGSYRPGYTHPDWEQALTALDLPERQWYQSRIGQAITGHPPTDGIMPVLQGAGENAKTLMTTDGPVKAFGDYADMASHKLITSQKAGSSEHSTEMADLRGQRLLIGEELSEGRSIDVTALKRIMDVSRIKARYVHKDNITFDASHTLLVTTNYRPVINETDHGTWRRLALLVFRYTYRKPGLELLAETDRTGDPELKPRIRHNLSGQHDAIVTWAVQGAMRWYGRGMTSLPLTARITADTSEWRTSADHIWGFWDEFLIADRGVPAEGQPCVGNGHLLAVFNAWLVKNGHNAWSKETFGARFSDHEMTTANGVGTRVTRALTHLSWYTGQELIVPAGVPSAQMRVWLGIRFRNQESSKTRQSDGRDKAAINFPSGLRMEKFMGALSHPSQAGAVRDVAPGSTERHEPHTEVVTPAKSSEKVKENAPSGTVAFDLETASASTLFTVTQRSDFVRLAGSLGDDGEPRITSTPELLDTLGRAAEITGHNIFGFDLLALAWHHGADWDALTAKARDTELIARQAWPPRSRESGTSQDSYDLDHVAQRLGLPGKTDDIGRLKRQYHGYDKIPVDDPEYRSYLEGDLRATAAVSARLHNDAYTAREHRLAAIAGRMTLNGFAVDRALLDTRLAEGQNRKREALSLLHDGWGLPLGKTITKGRGSKKHEEAIPFESPLSTGEGREWLAGMWERYQVPDPPRTGKLQKLAIGSDDLKAIADRPECPADLKAALILMGIITGTRTVYQTASDCLCPDGRVHPLVSMRQASGRWSVTNPGLTVFGKRGGRHHERDIFLPDPGHILLSFDLSQVDMRAMAGHSQDPGYMALFAPGRDAHTEIASQVGIGRQDAKAIGHGWNYGLGASRMIRNGLDEQLVHAFVAGMEQRFPVLIAWREDIRARGKAGHTLDNGFGRHMLCDPERAYTVAPALMGQGGARDIMCECLLRLPPEIYPMLRVMVHDEILLSVPRADALEVARAVHRAMTWTWRDVPILCDMAMGESWGECSGK